MTGRAVGAARVEVLTWLPAAAEPGVWRADLDGSRCRTSGQFLVEIGVVLGFPAYYGRNWDAFDECFSDLLDVTTGGMGYEFYDRPGRPERVLHLVVDHAEELLTDAEPRFLAVAMRNFQCPFPRYDPRSSGTGTPTCTSRWSAQPMRWKPSSAGCERPDFARTT